MALGAAPRRIVTLVSREMLLIAALGVAVGLCAYAAASVGISRILYDVRPWEPLMIALVVVFVGLLATLSTAPAAYRAARVDPASALRTE